MDTDFKIGGAQLLSLIKMLETCEMNDDLRLAESIYKNLSLSHQEAIYKRIDRKKIYGVIQGNGWMTDREGLYKKGITLKRPKLR